MNDVLETNSILTGWPTGIWISFAVMNSEKGRQVMNFPPPLMPDDLDVGFEIVVIPFVHRESWPSNVNPRMNSTHRHC